MWEKVTFFRRDRKTPYLLRRARLSSSWAARCLTGHIGPQAGLDFMKYLPSLIGNDHPIADTIKNSIHQLGLILAVP